MIDTYDILFLGRMFPKDDECLIRKKARVDMQDAANVLQWNIIDGILANITEGSMLIKSYYPIDSWPRHYKDAFIKRHTYAISKNCMFDTIAFCNITYIKQILCSMACRHAVMPWAKLKSSNHKIILCYTSNNSFMKAIGKAKKKNPSIRAFQIIADITEFAANDNATGIKKMYNSWQIKQNNRLKKYTDGYILLTAQMKDKLNIAKPYIVMEGIAPKRDDIIPAITQDNDVKTILYTGSMNKKYGILELLEAFSKIRMPDFQLVLCGLGNAESIINEYSERDSRILFLGKVPHDEVLGLQANATVLVNPRQNNEEFTKYSFPSKNLEYLSSGTPLVAYKLDGIPDEYDDYIYYVPDNDPVTLANRLTEVCEMPEEQRMAMGLKAREFVNKNKNPNIQAKRILDFIKRELIGND